MISNISALREEKYNATLVSVRRIHEGLVVVRVRPDNGALSFEPGQYATLGFGFWEERVLGSQEESERQKEKQGKLIRRPESFSHPILADSGDRLLALEELDFHEFLMNLVTHSPEGTKPPEFTPRLYHSNVREGFRLFCDEKVKGAYTLDLEDLGQREHLIFVSNGTGDAPHNTMIWKLIQMGYGGRITSVVSVCQRRDLAYLDVHEKLQALHQNYTHIPLTTEEAASPQSPCEVQEFVLGGGLENKIGEVLDPGKMSFFLCGSNSLIGVPSIDRRTRQKVYPKNLTTGWLGLIEILETRYDFMMDPQAKSSVERGNIHYEKWY